MLQLGVEDCFASFLVMCHPAHQGLGPFAHQGHAADLGMEHRAPSMHRRSCSLPSSRWPQCKQRAYGSQGSFCFISWLSFFYCNVFWAVPSGHLPSMGCSAAK